MRPGAVRASIRFRADPQLRVTSGQTVSLKVVKHLIGNKWAVSVGGRVHPAVSSVSLKAGQRLTAIAEVVGRQIVLHIEGPARGPANGMLERAGLHQDAITRAVVLALMHQGKPVDSQVVRSMVPHVRRYPRASRKAARSLAVALDKGIDLDSSDLSELLPLLMFEDGAHEERSGRHDTAKEADELSEELEETTTRRDEGSVLSLFNALREGAASWVVIPVKYDGIQGTVRLLMDTETGRLLRLVLDVTGSGEPARAWAFVMEGGHLSTFADAQTLDRRTAREYRILRTKLQNRGVKTDDSIREIATFDGYSHDDEEHIRGINALG